MASIVDPSKETELTPNDVPVVRDYVSVFPKDLLRLPLDRKTVFSIEICLKSLLFHELHIDLHPLN